MDNDCNCQSVETKKVDAKNEINEQSIKGNNKSKCGRRGQNIVEGIGGIDSSLLFFFLILVCIVCQCDMDISMDTLLLFFLLLVVLYQYNY